MILENPALQLSVGMQDILDILESTLKERNWTHFDVANLKLTYVPFYVFNYDTLVEKKVESDTYSQGFSGLMAMNAVTGKLEPLLTQILSEQPVNYEREISHDLQYEMQNPAILGDEVKESARLKLAGQFNVGKDSMSISGVRLVYWPIWKVFVTLPNKRIQKMEVEAVAGYPLNVEEVPEREKTWMEVTSETLAKLKTPQGWAELSKTAIKTTAAAVTSGAKNQPRGESSLSKLVAWLIHSKNGRYALIGIIAIIVILLFWQK
ncbi:MAG: hypothetical protein QXO69_00345 [archaeon]